MKFNVLRSLVFPWMVHFSATLLILLFLGVEHGVLAWEHPMFPGILGGSLVLPVLFNIGSLRRAGIWVTHGLPPSFKFSYSQWLMSSILSVGIAGAVYFVGQMPWVPLLWQAFVIPITFSIALYVFVRGLMGPVLKWSSNLTLGRALIFVQSLVVFATVPLTAVFLGKTIIKAYHASKPAHLAAYQAKGNEAISANWGVAPVDGAPTPSSEVGTLSPVTPEAVEFQAAVEKNAGCSDLSKKIVTSLDPALPEDQVYWACKAVRCAELRSIVVLPRLVTLMIEHKSSRVRAAAIQATLKFGVENVKKVSYLFVKKISEKEDPEVIRAAALVLNKLGEEERKFAINRLKNLLQNSEARASDAALVLAKDLGQEELIATHLMEALVGPVDQRQRSVKMVCHLSPERQAAMEPLLENIVASMKVAESGDPALEALRCLGPLGLAAIRKEILQPKHLKKEVAAQALTKMDLSGKADLLETLQACANDDSESVRRSCGQALGLVGGPALPKILEMLDGRDEVDRETAQLALASINDPAVRTDLERVRAENTGWTANNRKLKLAEEIDRTLERLGRR